MGSHCNGYAVVRHARISDAFIWAVGLLFALYWWHTPYMGDDMLVLSDYKDCIANGSYGFPVDKVLKIWRGMWLYHHFRLPDYVMAQLLPFVSKPVWDIASGCAVVMILRASVAITGARSVLGTAVIAVLFVFGMQWVSALDSHVVCFNYVWTFAFGLLFVRYIFRDSWHPGWIHGVVGCLVGWIAGASHEAMSLPLWCAAVLYMCLNRHRLSAWQWTVFVLFSMGLSLIVLCPSIFSYSVFRERVGVTLVAYTLLLSCFAVLPFVVAFVVRCRKLGVRGLPGIFGSHAGMLLVACLLSCAGSIMVGMPGRAPWFAQGFAIVGLVRCGVDMRLAMKPVAGRLMTVVLMVVTVGHMITVDCMAFKSGRNYERVLDACLHNGCGVLFADVVMPEDVILASLGKVRALQFFNIWYSACISEYYTGRNEPMRIVPVDLRGVELSRASKLPGDNPIWEWQGHWVARRDEISSWNVLLRYPLGKARNITLYHAAFVADDGMEYVYLYPYNLLPRSLIVAVDMR